MIPDFEAMGSAGAWSYIAFHGFGSGFVVALVLWAIAFFGGSALGMKGRHHSRF